MMVQQIALLCIHGELWHRREITKSIFFMLVLLRRTSFRDTFYVLYFSQLYTLQLQVYTCLKLRKRLLASQ